MATKTANVFAQFQGHEPKKAKIEALDGAEVTYRTLTMSESDAFQKRTVKEFDADGKPTFDFDALSLIRYEKVSLGLIDPAMTVEQLQDLDATATKAIVEIEGLISGLKDEDLVDEEGK